MCVIKQGETNCESIGSTDENGLISVAGDITAGQIVAKVIAGQTKDADKIGFAGKTYEMVADISSDTPNVITPFTTIDVLDETKTMADIAAELNLPEPLLRGDYIASEAAEKSRVHALARAIATELSPTKDENSLSALNAKVTVIQEYITTELTNTNVDLNTVNIVIDGGSVTHEVASKQIADFLKNGDAEVYIGSLNSSYFTSFGVRSAMFSDEQVMIGGGDTYSYKIEGDELITTVNEDMEKEKFLYTSANLALSVPLEDKDLIVTSHAMFGAPIDLNSIDEWEKSDFVDQTYYLLFDDADGEIPEPIIMTLTFSASTVVIIDGTDASVESPWEISLGRLKINMLDAGVGEESLLLVKSIFDENITLIREQVDGIAPGLLFKEESLAQAIFDKWLGLTEG